MTCWCVKRRSDFRPVKYSAEWNFRKLRRFSVKAGKMFYCLMDTDIFPKTGFGKVFCVRPARGETRPAATFSADKVIAAAEAAQSPLTSVYIHSCQSGAVFRDLKTLFEKNPAMAQKTEWFVAAAPLQPASSKPLPAQISGASVRERMLDKLLLNIYRQRRRPGRAGLGKRAGRVSAARQRAKTGAGTGRRACG